MAHENPRSQEINNRERNTNRKIENAFPFNLLTQGEMMWGPYGPLSKSLLHTHRNCLAFAQINRRLVDAFLGIARREQDFALDLSEKMLRQNAASEGSRQRAIVLPPESVDEIFDRAIAGVRDFGQAVVDAQVHSIEEFHKRAREAASSNEESASYAQAAE